MNNIGVRLKSEMDKRGLTSYALSKETGISESTLGRIINKNSKPNTVNIKVLCEYFGVSESWLLTGIDSLNDTQSEYELKKGTPYYDVEFTAGFMDVTNNQQQQPDSYVTHPFFAGCDYIVRASGQSMSKIIKHGDAIGLRKVDDWINFLPFGEVYAIVTKSGLRMVKIITAGSSDDTFTLISKPGDSKIDEFPPQEIKKELIKHVFKVHASSHLF